jgi:hypothetical protein
MHTDYAGEARQRWGDTEAYAESQRRASSYTSDDWLRIEAEADQVEQQFADLFAAGVAADSPEADAAAEAHRAHISRWFYDCSPQLQRALGEMYVADPRFAEHYDERAPGLATYVRDAIVAATS